MGANTKTVHRIREFNRFYLPALSLLGNHYLNAFATAMCVVISFINGIFKPGFSFRISSSVFAAIVSGEEDAIACSDPNPAL